MNKLILNIKRLRTTNLEGLIKIRFKGLKIAYCGNNYDYWRGRFKIINSFDNFSMLGKPHNCIVKGDRIQTIHNYESYVRSVLYDTIAFEEAMHKLNDYDALACWCAPLKCHCEVINKLIKEVNK